MKYSIFVFMVIIIFTLVFPSSTYAEVKKINEGTLIVKVKEKKLFKKLILDKDLKIVNLFDDWYVISSTKKNSRQKLKTKLVSSKVFSHVEDDYLVQGEAIYNEFNDPYYSSDSNHRSYLSMTHFQEAYDQISFSNLRGMDVIVAVIDGGINTNHEDLSGRIWINPRETNTTDGLDNDNNGCIDDKNGCSFINYLVNPNPSGNVFETSNSHATHISGIIAAKSNNSKGVAGLCSKCKIMSVKFLDSNLSGTLIPAIASIKYAADNGAKVINLSWAFLGNEDVFPQSLYDMIQYANNKGAIVVAAIGNYNQEGKGNIYPAELSNVIAVGAADVNSSPWVLSNYSINVDVSAPGKEIISTGVSSKPYLRMTGTSMATPHVSAWVASLISYSNTTTKVNNDYVMDMLKKTSEPINFESGSAKVGKMGLGIINFGNLVRELKATTAK